MAFQVNRIDDLVGWANSKSCEVWKSDRSCGHEGCLQVERAVDILTALHPSEPGVWMLVENDIDLTASPCERYHFGLVDAISNRRR